MATLRIQKSGWHGEIDRLIASLSDEEEEGVLFAGSLTVTGHEYWVILEYGSSPKTRNPLTHSQRGDVVKIRIPSGLPKSQNHRSWYLIEPRKAKRLVFWKDGRLQVRKWVHHPGIAARGFLRRIIADVQGKLFKALLKLDAEDTLPDRDQLRQVFNYHLLDMLERIRNATPVQSFDAQGFETDDEDSDGSHLRDAWGIDLAR